MFDFNARVAGEHSEGAEKVTNGVSYISRVFNTGFNYPIVAKTENIGEDCWIKTPNVVLYGKL